MNELQGAQLRLNRAGEHLPGLNEIIQAIVSTYENGVVAERDPESGDWEPTGNPVELFELRASVIIGEVVHNLRACLDYLVYALAQADSGRVPDRTQFPIEDSPQGFTARRNTFLEGVSDENVAIIRKYQPYNGCWWTENLRELSNADKHRELVRVKSDLMAVTGGLAVLPWDMEANTPLVDPDGNVPEVNMYLVGSATVVFPNGAEISETLAELQTEVGRLLSVFDFQFPIF
jgi:hypothetical protein